MHVPDYFVQSILCLFLCLPTGIVAIVQANKANQLKAVGDYHGAVNAAQQSKTWCWVSLAVGIGAILLWIIVAAAASNDPGYNGY